VKKHQGAKPSTEILQVKHTPPLGYAFLTPFYDLAIALLTREKYWRRLLVNLVDPAVDDFIVDVGSGTGSLAIAVHNRLTSCWYYGVDPDADAVRRARKKAKRHGSSAKFEVGYLNSEEFQDNYRPKKIVSSLVLHQVPLTEKKRILTSMLESLRPGGKVFIADYGLQGSRLSKFLFRATVQALDGVQDTQSNADGVIPELMIEAGFSDVSEQFRIPTLTGVISIYSGVKASTLNAEPS